MMIWWWNDDMMMIGSWYDYGMIMKGYSDDDDRWCWRYDDDRIIG